MTDDLNREALDEVRAALGHLESQAPDAPPLPSGTEMERTPGRFWSRPLAAATAITAMLLAAVPVTLWLRESGDDASAVSSAAPALDAVGLAASPDERRRATETTASPVTSEALAAASSEAGDEGAGSPAPAPPGLPEPVPPGLSEADTQLAAETVSVEGLDRSIVFTANLKVEVEDVVAAGEQAQASVAGLGGVLFGQETTTGQEPRSVLTIKILPENFREALGRLAGLGKLKSQTVFADDVTERVVDLQSRIATAETSVERLRSFLEDATDLEAVATLEGELLTRETDLEVLRGQLRTLEDQVALATIVLVLTEPIPPQPKPAVELLQTGYIGRDGGAGCPGADELQIDEGEQLTVCFEVLNTGNTQLTEIKVDDPGLDADEDDLIVVDGDLDSPLAPENRLMLAFETEADPSLWTDPTIQVTAVEADGEPVGKKIEKERAALMLRVAEDDSLPGFIDALDAAWHGLQWIFGAAVVLAGTIVPFLWVPILIGVGIWYLRRRRPPGPRSDEP